jgi:hypothetical protein
MSGMLQERWLDWEMTAATAFNGAVLNDQPITLSRLPDSRVRRIITNFTVLSQNMPMGSRR